MGEGLRWSSLILHTFMLNCGAILLIYFLQREQFWEISSVNQRLYKLNPAGLHSFSALIQSPCKSMGRWWRYFSPTPYINHRRTRMKNVSRKTNISCYHKLIKSGNKNCGTIGHSAFQGLLCTFHKDQQQCLKALCTWSNCDDTQSPQCDPEARDWHEHCYSFNVVMKASA